MDGFHVEGRDFSSKGRLSRFSYEMLTDAKNKQTMNTSQSRYEHLGTLEMVIPHPTDMNSSHSYFSKTQNGIRNPKP